MKTIELIVRINVQVPDDASLNLAVDFDSQNNKIFGLDILDSDSCPVDYTLNEYETMDVTIPH
jgi:hypothetical protein